MNEAATLIRNAREDAGLSLRDLAQRADVSYVTISRVENGRVDPSVGTLVKILSALGADLDLRCKKAPPVPRLADLANAWERDRAGQEQPDWTRLRAFLDRLARHPEFAARAIRAMPAPSGSTFFDNLLAGIAERIADDAGLARPAWTKRIPPLDNAWESLATPRSRAAIVAATPAQLAHRRIMIPARSLWREHS